MEITVRDDPERSQYVAAVDGTDVGVARYVESGTVRTFTHTEVDPSHQGQGIASELVRQAVRDVRSRDLQLIALCPYVKRWLEKHPGEADPRGSADATRADSD